MADRILCVVPRDLANASLVRGCSLARTANAELIIARIVADTLRVDPLSDAFDDSSFLAMRSDGVDDDTPLPARLVVDRVVTETTRIAFELAVAMVVVPVELTHRAVALAERLRVPVLLARPSRGSSVVVAIDLCHRAHSVLAAGRQLAERLDVPVVVVHNCAPAADRPLADRDALDHFIETTQRFGVGRTVVTHAPSAVDSILDVAREESADVVVVGVHRRSWLRRELDRGIPERLVREAGRSVLMVPVTRIEA